MIFAKEEDVLLLVDKWSSEKTAVWCIITEPSSATPLSAMSGFVSPSLPHSFTFSPSQGGMPLIVDLALTGTKFAFADASEFPALGKDAKDSIGLVVSRPDGKYTFMSNPS